MFSEAHTYRQQQFQQGFQSQNVQVLNDFVCVFQPDGIFITEKGYYDLNIDGWSLVDQPSSFLKRP